MEMTLSSGRIIEIDEGEIVVSEKAAGRMWLAKYNERRKAAMKPDVEIIEATGIVASFPDGAKVVLTVNGRFPCTLCGERQCEHLSLALPFWTRFKWDVATRPECPWGPSLLQGIGIDPPYIVDPALVYKQSRHAPFSRGEEIVPGVFVWRTPRGRLYHFWDNGRRLTNGERLPDGHVYVGSDHPDGHTPCLVCRDGCDHVKKALELEGI